jgi:5-methylcytosine-specific restriction protein A
MSLRVCTVVGCPVLVEAGKDNRCDNHRKAASRERSRNRPELKHYATAEHKRFRTAVLRRDPVCLLCSVAPSEIADHYPLSLRTLVARGLPLNDPANGRGLCWSCHSRETGRLRPGGWADR